ncbi:MAG: metallophosphoesterase [Clostridium sp.]
MKKILLKRILVGMVTSALTLQISPFTSTSTKVKADTISGWEKLEDKKSLRFAVISDTHVGPNKKTEAERLKNVFKTVYELDPNIDALSVVGDLTDSGAQSEYDVFKSVVDANKKPETKLIASMGNHEGNTAAKFTAATQNQPRQNTVINGYHFITLSPRSSQNVYGGSRYNLDEQWLREQLNAATLEDKTKPVFVFLHHGIKDTAYGTDEWNTPDLKNVLNEFPQVVNFGGHSHYPLNDPRSINQKDFTALNTSTISYFELETGMMYGTIPPNANNSNQMMVLDVDGTKVRIKKLDLLSGKYIGEDWVFDTALGKEGFKYTDARSAESDTPYFEASAAVKVADINDTGATITIDQAKINDKLGDNQDQIVHSYKYDFTNKKTGKVEKSYKIWSEYYFLPMASTLTQKFTGLKPGIEYEVSVTGLNSYKKPTTNIISSTFKTTGGIVPPTEGELNKPVDPAEIIDVDFEDGTAIDKSVTKNAFKSSGSPKVILNDKLNKNVGSFDGSSAFMYPFTDETYGKISKNLTLETAFKIEPFNSSYVDVFSNMESAGMGFEVAKIGGDTENANLQFWIRTRPGTTGTGAYTVISGNIKYSEYTHAMATYDGKTVKLYINGELENSKDVTGSVYYPTGASKVFCVGSDIGSTGNIDSAMTGEVSVARLYSRTLTDLDAFKLNKKEITDRNNKTQVILKDITNIDSKLGTEFKMPVAASTLPKDKNIRSAEMVFDIPKDLEVKSVELDKTAINADNFDYNTVDGKLRIALTNSNEKPLFVDGTAGNKTLANITFKLKEDKNNGDITTVKASNLTLRCADNLDINYDVKDVESKISFVKTNIVQAFPRELYTSSGTDVIPAGYKAYAIEFVGAELNSSVKSNNDNSIYYNTNFSSKNNKLTYVTIVKDTVTKEELSNIANYTLSAAKPEVENTLTFGDINNNGLDAQDALASVSSWLRKTEITNKGILTLNTSGDGSINTRDAIEIVDKFVSGKEFGILSK